MTKIEELAQRMLNFDENSVFDGYPGTTCHDEKLISAACIEYTCGRLDLCGNIHFITMIASNNITTAEQYANCQRFTQEVVRHAWLLNMIEGENAICWVVCEE